MPGDAWLNACVCVVVVVVMVVVVMVVCCVCSALRIFLESRIVPCVWSASVDVGVLTASVDGTALTLGSGGTVFQLLRAVGV
jgi:hypothetical protein